MTHTSSFLTSLAQLPRGYSEGGYNDRRYGTTISVSADGQRIKLYSEELGGNDTVSFNLYVLKDGTTRLKPCEMPAAKVIDFVLGYRRDA